jgi:hypothetical protein
MSEQGFVAVPHNPDVGGGANSNADAKVAEVR